MADLQSGFETAAGALAQKADILIQIIEFSQLIKQADGMSGRVLAATFLMNQ
jgi:trehalose/maltose hydrolase-like predicted phosphorylase